MIPPSTTAAEPAPPAAQPTTALPAHGSPRPALAALAVMLLAVVVGLLWSRPPRPVGADAPATGFSAARAQRHLRQITRAPHPVGSAEHERVRAYLEGELRRLGLEVQTQATTALAAGDRGVRAATVRNVVGRLRGTRSTGAVLLVAHYDAVPYSFGAADDGSGVTAILEALRALRAGPPLANDVIVLISDAEEVGLLGAAAFEEQHPWAREVGVVLNFEGRGRTGPVLMFETSLGNGRLIATAARAVRHPAGSSLMADIYRLLPNDTDLSVFLRARRPYPGLNFAFIGGHTHYHTPLDRYDQLNPATLQHHGEYALSLARAFGGQDLRSLDAPDHVYFDLPALGLVHYPFGWALPIALLAVLAAVAAVVVAARRRAVTGKGVALGFAAFLLSLVLAVAIAMGGWKMVEAARPGLRFIAQGDAYNADWWLIAFVGLVGAATLAVHALFRRWASAASLAVAALLAWALAALVTAVAMPGASYLFAWPLLLAAASAFVFLRDGEMGTGRVVGMALLAAPALMVFAPLVRMFEATLSFRMLAAPMAVLVFLLVLLVPQLDVLSRPRRWAPALALLAVGIVGLVVAFATSGFGPREKKPNSVAYLANADAGTARWISFDPAADEWTGQLLGEHPSRVPLAQLGVPGDDDALVADAPVVALAPPVARVVSDSAVTDGRRVRLHLASARGAQRMTVVVMGSAAVAGVEVNGRRPARVSPDRFTRGVDQRIVSYSAVPPEGIEVAFTVLAPAPLRLRIIETSYGLPSVPGGVKPRPEWMMSRPFVTTDMTILSRSLQI